MNDISLTPEDNAGVEEHCIACDNLITTGSRFCKHCGAALTAHETDNEDKWADIKQVAIFFTLEAVVCALINHVDYFYTLTWHIAAHITLAIVTVVFFCYNWTKVKQVLAWPNFSIVKLLSYCAAAVAASVIVSFTIDWLNKSLFSKEFSYYLFYSHYSYGKELTVFFIAVMPALFEELGYRGFMIGKLLNVVDRKQAVFISSFLFAIMHMSFISLFWLIPFALWQGYLRVKENTIWYGVFIHFTFNFTAVMIEFLQYNHK